jgi:hypothetical protein
MVALFSIVWFFSILGCVGAFLYGMFRPDSVVFWSGDATRWEVARKYGVSLLVLVFVLPVVGSLITFGGTGDYFEKNRKEVLARVDSLIQEEEPRAALDTIEAHTAAFSNQPTLDSLKGVARADTIYENVLEIPASETEKNIEAYEKLTDLDPNRRLFQRKLERYRKIKKQEEAAAKRRQEEQERQAQQEYMYSEAWAGDNTSAAWIMCQDFAEQRLRAPSTAEFPWMSDADINYMGDGEFYIRAYVDAENAFGAKLRNDFVCRIQHDEGKRWTLKNMEISSR